MGRLVWTFCTSWKPSVCLCPFGIRGRGLTGHQGIVFRNLAWIYRDHFVCIPELFTIACQITVDLRKIMLQTFVTSLLKNPP